MSRARRSSGRANAIAFAIANQSSFFGRSLEHVLDGDEPGRLGGHELDAARARPPCGTAGAPSSPSVRSTYLNMFAKNSIEPRTSTSSFFGTMPRSFSRCTNIGRAWSARSVITSASGPFTRSCRRSDPERVVERRGSPGRARTCAGAPTTCTSSPLGAPERGARAPAPPSRRGRTPSRAACERHERGGRLLRLRARAQELPVRGDRVRLLARASSRRGRRRARPRVGVLGIGLRDHARRPSARRPRSGARRGRDRRACFQQRERACAASGDFGSRWIIRTYACSRSVQRFAFDEDLLDASRTPGRGAGSRRAPSRAPPRRRSSSFTSSRSIVGERRVQPRRALRGSACTSGRVEDLREHVGRLLPLPRLAVEAEQRLGDRERGRVEPRRREERVDRLVRIPRAGRGRPRRSRRGLASFAVALEDRQEPLPLLDGALDVARRLQDRDEAAA